MIIFVDLLKLLQTIVNFNFSSKFLGVSYLYSYSTKRFKFLRPIFKVTDFKKSNFLQSDSVSNENAVLWWKYAINSVIRLQKEKKGFINAFKIPKTRMRDYEVNFMKLFQKYLDKRILQ